MFPQLFQFSRRVILTKFPKHGRHNIADNSIGRIESNSQIPLLLCYKLKNLRIKYHNSGNGSSSVVMLSVCLLHCWLKGSVFKSVRLHVVVNKYAYYYFLSWSQLFHACVMLISFHVSLPNLKIHLLYSLITLTINLTVLILAVCRMPRSNLNSVKQPCSPWVLIAQSIDRPPGVREVMGLIPARTQSFSLSHAHAMLISSLFTFHYRD